MSKTLEELKTLIRNKNRDIGRLKMQEATMIEKLRLFHDTIVDAEDERGDLLNEEFFRK